MHWIYTAMEKMGTAWKGLVRLMTRMVMDQGFPVSREMVPKPLREPQVTTSKLHCLEIRALWLP